jgi:glutamate-1-semialdehyde 2,1-aminomutase
MALLAPLGPVYQAGTLSGNPVATAAGLATLEHCTPELYARLGEVADTITAPLHDQLSAHGVPHVIQRAGGMFSVFFRDGAVRDYDEARAQHVPAYAAFFHSMLSQGVYLPPSAFESWFVSGAHDDRALERVVTAIPAAASAAAAAFATIGS